MSREYEWFCAQNLEFMSEYHEEFVSGVDVEYRKWHFETDLLPDTII